MIDTKLTGAQYSKLIAGYINSNFQERGIEVYTEITLGKTVIGKNRRIDILLINEQTNDAFAIECKYQDVKGTVDEKLVYAILDIEKLRIDGCIVYAGQGFSAGVLHLLESSPICVYAMPQNPDARNKDTLELDHILAMKFGWWDLIVNKEKQYQKNIGLFK